MTDRETMLCGKILQPRCELEFDWKINDFMLFSDEGHAYSSPVFWFSDLIWNFQIYPRGDGSDNDLIIVYLVRSSSHDRHYSKTVDCSLVIKSEISPDNFEMKLHRSEGYTDGNASWDCKFFLKRSELLEQKSKLLSSRHLTIRCCLTSSQQKAAPVTPQPIELTEHDTLSKDLGSLLEHGAKCDVTLNVQDKQFRAHRLVLGARSEVMGAMFEHDSSESKTGIVDIVDCDSDSFAYFLRYIYTGKLDEISPEQAYELYKTADKYGVLKLMSICVGIMTTHLSVNNVCEYATLAERHTDYHFLSLVLEYFDRHFIEIVVTDSWKRFVAEEPSVANTMLKCKASDIKRLSEKFTS